jgi:molybdopterin converting factor small subunit
MTIRIRFHSYFKDLAGCAEASEQLPDKSTVGFLVERLHSRFPKLAAMRNSTLVAVGVEYQRAEYVLRDGDEVSLFPPVQGG